MPSKSVIVEPDPGPSSWHALDPAEASSRLAVVPGDGLAADEVARRLGRYGPNRLTEAARRPPWLAFVDQFRNLLIVVLMGAAILAGLVGDFKDTVVIGVVLLFNAVIGFVQEHRAERSLEALKRMLVATARVRRDGVVKDVSAEDLVPGDVVLVEAGDRLPAASTTWLRSARTRSRCNQHDRRPVSQIGGMTERAPSGRAKLPG